jgi:hypothetical protein
VNDIILELPRELDPISMNEGDTWKVRGLAKEWRDLAYFHWCKAHPGAGPSGRKAPTPGVVHVTIPFAVHRRRDPINYAKTVKHIVDGLVLAGAWPDDTLEYVEQQIPTLVDGKKLPVLVRISTRPE